MRRLVFLLIFALAKGCSQASAGAEEVLPQTSVRKRPSSPMAQMPVAAVLKAMPHTTGARCGSRGAGVPGAGRQCYGFRQRITRVRLCARAVHIHPGEDKGSLFLTPIALNTYTNSVSLGTGLARRALQWQQSLQLFLLSGG